MTTLAWYFSTGARLLRYDDGRPITLGVTHTHDREPVLCDLGLHASVRALDALVYAPGPILWRVECGGTLVHGEDKLVCTERTYIAGGVDASSMLHAFARWCALDVAHLWDCPDVVARYLVTGDESLRAAARHATWTVTSADSAATAKAAAWAAVRDAAEIPPREAALTAARRGLQRAAHRGKRAWDAARDAQSTQFKKMCEDLLAGNKWWEVEQ